MAYDIKIDNAKKSIGQKFVSSLGPKIFNLLKFNLKRYLRTYSKINVNIY